jgi:hypothetical protein
MMSVPFTHCDIPRLIEFDYYSVYSFHRFTVAKISILAQLLALETPDRIKEMPCPLICYHPVGTEDNPQLWMQGVELGNSPSTETQRVIMHLFQIQVPLTIV